MKEIVFFPGWPKMNSLLKPFLDELREGNSINTNETNEPTGELILVGYSAGIIPLLEFWQANQDKVAKIILISPAGSVRRGFLSHCSSFVAELVRFAPVNLWLAFRIALETIGNFIFHPWRSWKAINQIRKYDLWEEIKKIDTRKVILINSVKDRFMRPRDLRTGAKYKKAYLPGTHFRIVAKPGECVPFILQQF